MHPPQHVAPTPVNTFFIAPRTRRSLYTWRPALRISLTRPPCCFIFLQMALNANLKPTVLYSFLPQLSNTPTFFSLDYTGGVATALNISSRTKAPDSLDQDSQILHHSLHPQDLISYTRKPFFLIVDSTNSTAFRAIPNVFGMPFACLLSPTEYPSSIKGTFLFILRDLLLTNMMMIFWLVDITQIGSLFSLFLHCPIKAFAFISDVNTVAPGTWDMGISQMEALERIISDLLDTDASLGTLFIFFFHLLLLLLLHFCFSIDKSYKRFIQDDFLRQFVVRFIITTLLLSSHTAFKDPKVSLSYYSHTYTYTHSLLMP